MIKDDMIYWRETEEWIDTASVLQEIVDMASDVTKKAMTLKFVHCSDVNGNRHGYPSIRVASGYEADEVSKYLNDVGVPAEPDLYEDDDGYPGQLRQIWSVHIPTYKVKPEDAKTRFECTNYVWNSDKLQYEKVSK